MTSKLTREQLHERARENVKALKMASRQTAFESAREEILADLQLAELALAAMDGEPVAEVVSIYGDPEAFGEREIRPLVGIQQMPYGTKLYLNAQQPVVLEENHIGSKNALDAIVSFIKSKSNPTVKCYEEVSEQLFKDNCHGIHSHVIEYILKLGEELEDLRAEQAEMQPAPVVPDELLKEYLRLVDCMLSDYRNSNYGDAQRWIGHIVEASDAFEEKHGLSPWEMARKNCREAMIAATQKDSKS